jgi:hypothetical protein
MDERLPAERSATPPATGDEGIGGSAAGADRVEVLA